MTPVEKIIELEKKLREIGLFDFYMDAETVYFMDDDIIPHYNIYTKLGYLMFRMKKEEYDKLGET